MTKEQKSMNNLALSGGYPLITQYIRDKRGRRVGMMVAFIVPGDRMFRIGHSKCNMNLDKFDPNRAFEMAVGRGSKNREMSETDLDLMLNENRPWSDTPRSIQPQYKEFVKRACRYFRVHV